MSDELAYEHFRGLLSRRLAELENVGAADSRRDSVELDQSKVGRLSRMDALQQQAMVDAINLRARNERARIRAALARMDGDDYGWCRDCGEPIGAARLNVDPATTLCVLCARKAEAH